MLRATPISEPRHHVRRRHRERHTAPRGHLKPGFGRAPMARCFGTRPGRGRPRLPKTWPPAPAPRSLRRPCWPRGPCWPGRQVSRTPRSRCAGRSPSREPPRSCCSRARHSARHAHLTATSSPVPLRPDLMSLQPLAPGSTGCPRLPRDHHTAPGCHVPADLGDHNAPSLEIMMRPTPPY